MHHLAHEIFAKAAILPAADPKTVTRDLMEPVMQAVATTVVALNFAHHRELGSNSTGDLRRMQAGSAYDVALKAITPPEGMYHAWLHFLADRDGFSITVHGDTNAQETVFQIHVDDRGTMQFGTYREGGLPVRFEPLPGNEPGRIMDYVGAWMQRNFSHQKRLTAQKWLPGVVTHLRRSHPSQPNMWHSPFDLT